MVIVKTVDHYRALRFIPYEELDARGYGAYKALFD